MEDSIKELKRMVSAETLLNYLDLKIIFNVHTYTYDKYLGDVTSNNNKTIAFLKDIKKSKS